MRVTKCKPSAIAAHFYRFFILSMAVWPACFTGSRRCTPPARARRHPRAADPRVATLLIKHGRHAANAGKPRHSLAFWQNGQSIGRGGPRYDGRRSWFLNRSIARGRGPLPGNSFARGLWSGCGAQYNAAAHSGCTCRCFAPKDRTGPRRPRSGTQSICCSDHALCTIAGRRLQRHGSNVAKRPRGRRPWTSGARRPLAASRRPWSRERSPSVPRSCDHPVPHWPTGKGGAAVPGVLPHRP